MHELLIRNGTVVDGTGENRKVADVAVNDGLISAVGTGLGPARREIEADGLLVLPGWVDIHTHYDGQATWDPFLTPSSWHGVTTALMGNCGVTFAPCRSGDRELLAGMMETVEDIPKDAILTGLPWNWEHYGEYLDSVETMNPAIIIRLQPVRMASVGPEMVIVLSRT